MTANLIERELLEVVQSLTDAQKQTVLQYARTIDKPVGTPGWKFVKMARELHFDPEDVAQMEAVIEEEFGYNPDMSPTRFKRKIYEALQPYAGKGLNGESYLTHNFDWSVFALITLQQSASKNQVGVSIIVRIVGEHIIIERDQNDKLVVDALVQAGVPREEISLAYAGEQVPELANM